MYSENSGTFKTKIIICKNPANVMKNIYSFAFTELAILKAVVVI
jgi:hypothetical protein